MPPTFRVGPGPRGFETGHGPGLFAGHPLVGGLVALLVITLLVALAVAAVVVLVRGGRLSGARQPSPRRASTDAPPSDEALRILNERLARGEIDAGDYAERRDLLKQSA